MYFWNDEVSRLISTLNITCDFVYRKDNRNSLFPLDMGQNYNNNVEEELISRIRFWDFPRRQR